MKDHWSPGRSGATNGCHATSLSNLDECSLKTLQFAILRMTNQELLLLWYQHARFFPLAFVKPTKTTYISKMLTKPLTYLMFANLWTKWTGKHLWTKCQKPLRGLFLASLALAGEPQGSHRLPTTRFFFLSKVFFFWMVVSKSFIVDQFNRDFWISGVSQI